jgi:HD-like signal output (HDOD) protein
VNTLHHALQESGAPDSDPAQFLAPLAPAQSAELGELFQGWQRLARSDHVIPPISPLALRLVAFDLNAQQASRELVSIVESDPLLTARVLGLANAAAQARAGKPIFEVQGAVLRLGMKNVAQIAMAQLTAAWMRKVGTGVDRDLLRTLWCEYLVTAACSAEIARALDEPAANVSLAYAAGLLHDVGTLALCGLAPEPMRAFVRSGYAAGTALHGQFVEAHTRLGEAVLVRFGAPASLCEVAARHHAGFDTSESAITMVVYLADHLHGGVFARTGDRLSLPSGYPPGCFPGIDDAAVEAMVALGLEDALDATLDRVAAEGGRIEVLAADLP